MTLDTGDYYKLDATGLVCYLSSRRCNEGFGDGDLRITEIYGDLRRPSENFCIFPYPFAKKEIVALLLNRNTEAERF